MRGYRKYMFDVMKTDDVVSPFKTAKNNQSHISWVPNVMSMLNFHWNSETSCLHLGHCCYKWAQPQSAMFQHVNQQTYYCTFARVFSQIHLLFSCFQNKGEPDFIVSNVFGLVLHCIAFPFAWPFLTIKEINFSSLGDDQLEVPLSRPEEEAAFRHCNHVQVHLLSIISDAIAGSKFLGQQLQQRVQKYLLLQLVSDISLQADAKPRREVFDQLWHVAAK